jgi:hypothetical protein
MMMQGHLIARIALVLLLLCSASVSWGANTSIQNGESGLSVRNKLNTLLGKVFNVKQPPYNAAGNGSANDYNAIQNAINDACATGVGGTVYLPEGNYNIGSNSINFDACINVSNPHFVPGIALQGAGLNQGFGRTTIQCSTVGFCVDKHNVDTATGTQMPMGLATLDGMQISNNLQDYRGLADVGGGAVRFEGATAGLHVSNCWLTGGVGLVMQQGTFSGSVDHCNFSGGGGMPGSVGIYAGQIGINDIRMVGWNAGVVNSYATTITNLSTESSNTGVLMGILQPNTFRGYIDNNSTPGTYSGNSGSILTVTKYAYGTFDNDNGSGAGGHGPGIQGPKYAASAAATWSSANGGTLTFHLAISTNSFGPAACATTGFVGSIIPAGYNFTNVNCHWNGSTVTILGSENPGAPISGSIRNPGTNTVWAQGQGLLARGNGSGGASYSGMINTTQCPRCTAGTTVVAQISSTQSGGFPGAEGSYLLDRASNVPSQTIQTSVSGVSTIGASIRGWQTERLNTGLAIATSVGVTVSNVNFTGTIGLGVAATSAAWSAPNNGTLTYTLRYDSGRTGLKVCFAESFSAGYNFDQTSNPAFPDGVNCQWNGITVQIKGTDNPAINGGNITNPGANSSAGVVSPQQDACIYFGGSIKATTIRNAICGTHAVPQLDFSTFGIHDAGWLVLDNIRTYNGIVLPPHNTRAGVVVRNSEGLSPADFQVNYADLPGRAFTGFGASEGQEFLIVDAHTCSDGTDVCNMGANVTAGGGSLHRKVRYNGTNWTVIGK